MEQDPAELLASVRQCLSEVGKTLQSKALQLKGVGITNQRETTILWDKTTGHALHRAIGGRGATHSTHAHIIYIHTHTYIHTRTCGWCVQCGVTTARQVWPKS